MISTVRTLLDLGQLPFHLGANDVPSNDGLPDTLPFALGVREDVGLLVQVPHAGVAALLEEAYSRNFRFGTAMSGESIGSAYADDFLTFLREQVVFDLQHPIRVLEIGCGTGYLLHRVRELGAEVTGIEPAEYGQEGAARYGLDIRREMFRGLSDLASSRFDLILHYAVLEHVEDPVSWLRLQSRYLLPSGAIAFAVPNDREYILHGDISTFCHEHWNYFSPSSLARVVEEAGLRLTYVRHSGYGASIYAIVRPNGAATHPPEDYDLTTEFGRQIEQFTGAVRRFVDTNRRSGRSLGIYCPGRAINVLHHLQIGGGFRFFDDDPNIHGKFLPPCTVPVEPRSALLDDPVDDLLIMSLTFGQKLREELRQCHQMQGTLVRTIGDILPEPL